MKLGQCPRCKGYGLIADVQGLRVALDVAPLDALGFGLAVANRVGLWRVEKRQDGTPGRLRAYSATSPPSWVLGGAQAAVQGLGLVHAEHSCGAPARDMVILNVTGPKDSAPATPGAAGAGNLLRDALAAVAQDRATRSPAPSATPRPSSEVLGNCGICGRRIRPGEKYWSVTHGHIWIDGTHEECP